MCVFPQINFCNIFFSSIIPFWWKKGKKGKKTVSRRRRRSPSGPLKKIITPVRGLQFLSLILLFRILLYQGHHLILHGQNWWTLPLRHPGWEMWVQGTNDWAGQNACSTKNYFRLPINICENARCNVTKYKLTYGASKKVLHSSEFFCFRIF